MEETFLEKYGPENNETIFLLNLRSDAVQKTLVVAISAVWIPDNLVPDAVKVIGVTVGHLAVDEVVTGLRNLDETIPDELELDGG